MKKLRVSADRRYLTDEEEAALQASRKGQTHA